jgi:hypothetical protein
MKVNKNILMLVMLVLIMMLEPIPFEHLYNTFPGRAFILSMVVFFTINHTILGLLATIILLASLQVYVGSGRQGFTNNDPKTLTITGKDRVSIEYQIRPKNICNIKSLRVYQLPVPSCPPKAS